MFKGWEKDPDLTGVALAGIVISEILQEAGFQLLANRKLE